MIPKRAISALIATVFALALLFSFKTPAAPSLAGSTASGTVIVGQPTPIGSTAAPAATSTAAPSAMAPTATTDTSTTTTAGYVDGTVSGPVVSTRFGDVQVQVTISGGSISDVTALQLPSTDGRSRRISEAAEPILREEALRAQTASIDLVSGATYTSRAYEQSLQAALDQATA